MEKKTIYLILFILGLSAQTGYSQVISGKVYGYEDDHHKEPLPGVNIYWKGTTTGTVSDARGTYSISAQGIKDKHLVFSFMGYYSDTVEVAGEHHIDLVMVPANLNLNEVVIKGSTGSSYISRLKARNLQVVTKGELFRAACCNLAESFETNASIDVMYSDAITGAKQIQLLGLSGVYSQIVTENVPLVRGLGTSFGLNYVPGSWMESIYVSKGTSSVINGFESITGQINVECKKPATSEKLFVNLYGSDKARFEANFNASHKFNDHLSTMIMGHASRFQNAFDKNQKDSLGDRFMDIPKVNTINVFNRWDYIIPNKMDSRMGIKFLTETRNGGTIDFKPSEYQWDTSGITARTKEYGIELNTNRMEVFWKNGFMMPDDPHKSIGTIISGIIHEQEGFFGLNRYEGKERSLHAQVMYATPVGNESHMLTSGFSLQAGEMNETYYRTDFRYQYELPGMPVNSMTLWKLDSTWKTKYRDDREEVIPGVFMEYTYKPNDALSVILGIRADHHNAYGTFVTPRFHFRYQPAEHFNVKGSAGKGYRTMNIFPENYALMASQRKIQFVEQELGNKGFNFGLNQEEAWNFGINMAYDFLISKRKAQIDLDFYRTVFVHQVVVDMDSDPAAVYFSNLDGESFSNVGQVQFTMEPVKGLSFLAAFRLNDVQMTVNGDLRTKPFTNAYKGLLTLGYVSKFEKWKFDFTTQFNGKGRIPDTDKMPAGLQRPGYSPEFIQILAQVTRKYKNWDFYLGSENLTNFIQDDPITEWFAPYHTHFDTSMVWGPLVGRTVYAGLRYTL